MGYIYFILYAYLHLKTTLCFILIPYSRIHISLERHLG